MLFVCVRVNAHEMETGSVTSKRVVYFLLGTCNYACVLALVRRHERLRPRGRGRVRGLRREAIPAAQSALPSVSDRQALALRRRPPRSPDDNQITSRSSAPANTTLNALWSGEEGKEETPHAINAGRSTKMQYPLPLPQYHSPLRRVCARSRVKNGHESKGGEVARGSAPKHALRTVTHNQIPSSVSNTKTIYGRWEVGVNNWSKDVPDVLLIKVTPVFPLLSLSPCGHICHRHVPSETSGRSTVFAQALSLLILKGRAHDLVLFVRIEEVWRQ